MTYKDVLKVAQEYAAQLPKMVRPSPPTHVVIVHRDGTMLYFRFALALEYHHDREHLHRHSWIMVFTEHHGFHVYPMEDLVSCNQYADAPLGKFAPYAKEV